MCGISGIYRFDKKKVKKSDIENQLNLIRHRGPDGSGIYVNQNIGLGHVRLSILELSEAGAQPMKDDRNEYVLTYNGETYNYEYLRKYLKIPAKKYSGNSDTEVILNGLIQQKENFVKQMEGMFAFALYDKKANKMILARDHFGIKPLYYHCNSNRIVFSSEIKPLLTDNEIVIKEDMESIKEHLVLGYALEPKTAFKDVFKLPPGHLMIVGENGIEIKKYWDIEELIVSNDNTFSDKFNESVLKHTMADVPLGMFLSGGFDSNIILQSLYRHNKTSTNFNAYNIGSENKNVTENNLFSERNIARLSSKMFKTNLVEINIEGTQFISFSEAIKTVEEPVCNPSNILIDHITKLAHKNGNKVLISGHGGDEVFGGYRRHVAIRYLKYLKTPIGRFLLKKLKNRLGENLYYRLKMATEKGNMVPHFDLISLGWDAIHQYKCLGDFIDDEDINKMRSKIQNIISPLEKYSPLKQMMLLDLSTYLCAQNLINMDKFSMKNSIEVRVPYLYKPLTSIGLSQKDKGLIKGKKTKVLIRGYAKNTLPSEIQNIKKSGFSPALIDLAQSDEVQNILFSKKAKERGIFDLDNLKKFINKTSKFTESDAMALLNYVYVEQWFRTFIDSKTFLNND